MKEINYVSSTKEKIQLEASYIQPSIRIRNLKDSILSVYENFYNEEVNCRNLKEEQNQDKLESSFTNDEIKHEEFQNYNNNRYSYNCYNFCDPSQINYPILKNSWNHPARNNHKNFKKKTHNITSQIQIRDQFKSYKMNQNPGYNPYY